MPVSIGTKTRANVECEGCGHSFSYSKNVEARTQKALAKKINNHDIGYMRCPRCRYMQSWMVRPYKRDVVPKILIFCAMLGFFTGMALNYLLGASVASRSLRLRTVAWIDYAILCVCVPILAAVLFRRSDPNRRQVRELGEVPSERKPKISVEHPHLEAIEKGKDIGNKAGAWVRERMKEKRRNQDGGW